MVVAQVPSSVIKIDPEVESTESNAAQISLQSRFTTLPDEGVPTQLT